MTIHITIPSTIATWHLRRLLAVICLFAPQATVQIGTHRELTLPSQISPAVDLSRARLHLAGEENL